MAVFTDVFEDVTKYGKKLQTSEYKESGKYVIIDQGQKDIAGYTDETDGVFTDVPAIVFGDHTRVIKYVDEPCFLGADGVKLLKAKIENPNYKYLYYVLSNADIPNTGYNRHFKWLKEVEIPLPNIEEQNKIVETLEKVDELISCRKEQLAKLDELVKARFVEMFGDPEINQKQWNEDILSNHLEVIGGYAFKSENFEENGIPVLRIGNINSGKFLSTNMVYWRNDSSLERYKMRPGDLVMSLTGTVGKNDYGNVCILGNDYDEYYLNQRNAKLDLKQTLNKHYLSEMLKFNKIKTRLTGISRGVRQANISNKDILALCVPIPPIDLQEQFAAFVELTEKTKAEIQKSLDELETLKKSLMQKYFG